MKTFFTLFAILISGIAFSQAKICHGVPKKTLSCLHCQAICLCDDAGCKWVFVKK